MIGGKFQVQDSQWPLLEKWKHAPRVAAEAVFVSISTATWGTNCVLLEWIVQVKDR
jgi:hypothetical protein